MLIIKMLEPDLINTEVNCNLPFWKIMQKVEYIPKIINQMIGDYATYNYYHFVCSNTVTFVIGFRFLDKNHYSDIISGSLAIQIDEHDIRIRQLDMKFDNDEDHNNRTKQFEIELRDHLRTYFQKKITEDIDLI